MAKISKKVVVLVGVVFCVMFLMGTTSDKKTPSDKQEENRYRDARVLVEAFVVEVELDALYDAGVGLVGQKPNSVSMEKILRCLRDKDKAKVTAGAKVAARNNEKGQMSSRRKIHHEKSVSKSKESGDVAVLKTFVPYSISIEFVVLPKVSPDSKIKLEFAFEQERIEVASENDRPPDFIGRDWTAIVSLEAGKPSIVGAIQNEETAVFLVICADIEKE